MYAIERQDAGALNNVEIRQIMRDSEFTGLVWRIREEVLPQIDDIRREQESEFPYDDDPDDYMRPLIEYFEALQVVFADEVETVRTIGDEIEMAWEWVFENSPEEEEAETRELETVERDVRSTPARSIFDDIDE